MPKITKKKPPTKPAKKQEACSICFGNKKHKSKLYLNNKLLTSVFFYFILTILKL